MLRVCVPPPCFPRSPGCGGGLLKGTHMEERLSWGDVPRQPKLQSSRSGSGWGEGQKGLSGGRWSRQVPGSRGGRPLEGSTEQPGPPACAPAARGRRRRRGRVSPRVPAVPPRLPQPLRACGWADGPPPDSPPRQKEPFPSAARRGAARRLSRGRSGVSPRCHRSPAPSAPFP